MKLSKTFFLISAILSMLLPLISAVELTSSQQAQLNALPHGLKQQAMDELSKFESNNLDQVEKPETPVVVVPKTTVPIEETERQTITDKVQEDTKLAPYGYELFSGTPTTYAPVSDIPIPIDYVIGPGDQVRIQYFGKESNSIELYVARDGSIHIPELGPISAAGKTFDSLREEITTLAEEQQIGVRAFISLGELRSIRVFILGDVNYPGSYSISSLSTITNALFVSGGISNIGSLRNIQLKRNGSLVGTFDLYDLLLRGDTSSDLILEPGDVIFVPPVGPQFGISGEVKRPAIYEMRDDEVYSINSLVKYAGGFTSAAYKPLSQIERFANTGVKEVVDVDLSNPKALATKLVDGDILRIYSSLERIENIVSLEGQIERPGNYQWEEGLRISNLIGQYDDLTNQADLDYALVISRNQINGYISVRSFSPKAVLENHSSDQNVELRMKDRIIVFNTVDEISEEDKDNTLNKINKPGRKELTEIIRKLESQSSSDQPQQIVEIAGHVRYPGKYPLDENMLLKDLIRAGGGFSQEAFTLEAELLRYDDNLKKQRETILVPVSLEEKNSSLNLALKPFDQLMVKRIPKWNENESIILKGEVKFPGTYTIERGEKLSSVIARAGGLTELAYPEGAVFIRQSQKEAERIQLERLRVRLREDISVSKLQEGNSGTIAIDSAEALADQLDSTQATGRIVIDLPSMLEGSNSRFDIALENGDTLTVSQKPQSISVVGSVNYPTSHFYDPKLNRDDYINLSGGVLERADKKRIYIVRANGQVEIENKSRFFPQGGISVKAGDTIVVPIDVDRMKPLKYWGAVSQIIYQLALGAAAVNSF
ncbi:SLBB domain-containing protein [Puniceicoccaceae bacterium K14]|nr:SLBB domain-containing protein [Puniceicoccaceae bacterium K14]